mmetsp:Transcript_36715/g.56394  ORF Transcript_36715/g.56394 Transcript_36715/m.56394 type:complete len:264 (+) Transcript_36715:1330-2121(+)
MLERSILAFLAKARAVGVAAMTPAAGVCFGFSATAPFFKVDPPDAAAATSEAVILPFGPVPVTVLKSIPSSAALFFANGEATTRSPVAAAATTFGAAFAFDTAAAGCGVVGAAAAGAPDRVAAYAWRAGISFSSFAISATGAPTAPLSPSSVIIAARYPSSNASTSISALSLSTTIIASPAEIGSPSALSHETTFPSFMVEDNAGISTLLKSKSGAAAPSDGTGAGAGAAASDEASTDATSLISSSDAAISATVSPTGALSPS